MEPVAEYHKKLERARPRDVNLKVAVGIEGQDFFEVDGTGLSGFISEASRVAVVAAGYTAKIAPKDVISLAELTRRYVADQQVDFLKIDVEGGERSVIESGEWRGFRPRVIVIEAVEPMTNVSAWFEWEGLLFDAGYEFALFDGLNRFYYRCEEPELREPLSVPANVLDHFIPYRMRELQQRLKKLQTQVARPSRQSRWLRLFKS